MDIAIWFILAGTLLITMVLISATLRRLSLTAAVIYLLIGIAIGDVGISILTAHPLRDVSVLRLITEIAVIISLFTTGLKLRLPLRAAEWRTPVLLSTFSMLITIAVVAVVAFFGLRLSLGESILLGAILAPTDPVLASSVQVLGPSDQDRLRFSLTAEAGLNDGTAFPFVMLGLGLLGLRDLGDWGLRWLLMDLFWGVLGGLAIGTVLSTLVGKLIGFLRAAHKETRGYDDFLALGLIALTYGLALQFHTYGFMAVFAAGLALRRRERQETDSQERVMETEVDSTSSASEQGAPTGDSVSGQMARSLLYFNEQMERVCELVVVIILGAMLSPEDFTGRSLVIAATLILVARPLSVFFGVRVHRKEHRALLAWFGIRGLGSLYYLAFAIEQGLSTELAETLIGFTFSAVVISIVIHGLTSARLMLWHNRRAHPPTDLNPS